MALELKRQTLEAERLIGARRTQALVRTEAPVPGAGRDAIEPLLADATLFIDKADAQKDRVVIEGTLRCQAVYRQGEETALRALEAQASLNHVLDLPGAEPGTLCRVRGGVAHVDTRYENGRMVFQISCDLEAQALSLSPAEVITDIEGQAGIQADYVDVVSCKLAAEASEMALLRDSVNLPAALDARAALMDWVTVEVTEVAPDLGGVRVKGRALTETLVASGVAGRPAVLVRYPIELDQLVEMPEWLTGDVFARTELRSVKSRVEPDGEAEGDMRLACEIELRVSVLANATDRVRALADAYATQGSALDVKTQNLELCVDVKRTVQTEIVRGTLLIGENAPGVGVVIAAQVRPVIGEWRNEDGRGEIEGVMEARVLYMPGGSDLPAAAEAELPFSIKVAEGLDETSLIDLNVLSAEANALMSDRLEMKLQTQVVCETRTRTALTLAEDVALGEPIRRRPGIVIHWPDAGETAWGIGKRYGVPAEAVGQAEAGAPVVLRM